MADILTPTQRSQMMARIRGKDTEPEFLVRRALHRRGFRYRLHDKRLPGKPDLVFPGLHAVILVHGCFWHGHDCHLYRLPSTRPVFWLGKSERNRANDEKVEKRLEELGWRQMVIWECALRGKERLPPDAVADEAAGWLRSSVPTAEIRGVKKLTDGGSR